MRSATKSAKAQTMAHRAAQLSVNPRLPAPASLNTRELQIWGETTGALEAAWFAPEQAPLLARYCVHVCRAEQLEAAIAGLHPVEDIEKYAKLAMVAAGESAKVLAFGRALRLTNQSRLRAETAGNRSAAMANLNREFNADDDELLA